MKRKLLTLIVATIFITSMISGCGNSTSSETTDNTESVEETATKEATTEETENEVPDSELESIEESEPEVIENEQEQVFVQTESVTTDADGNVEESYVYGYNEKGEQIRREYISSWDILGESITTTDVEEYEYDAKGNRVKEIIRYDGRDTDWIIESTYDDEGNILSYKEYDGDILYFREYEYDSDKKLTKETLHSIDENENDSITSSTEYTYDSDKNLIEETRYSDDGTESMKTKYEYNDMGDKVSDSIDFYEYAADTLGYTNVLNEYEYDDQNRLSLSTRYEDGQLVSKVVTEYDDNGNILRETKYDENDSLESITEYKYMLLQDYLDSEKNDITEQEMEENQPIDDETNETEPAETNTVETSGRKAITPKEIVFLYDGSINLEKIYYRTSENASWTVFFDGIAEPGSVVSNSTGTITLYEGYFGVKLVFDNGATERIHTINLVEGQIKNYDGSIGTTEYTGEMVEFIITDKSENFLDVNWS